MLVANRPDLSDIPLVVLTAGRTGPSPLPPDIVERLDQVRQDTQEELLSLSTNSTHVLVEDSGHGIPQERPNVVIAAIRQVLDEVRGGKTAALSTSRRTPPAQLVIDGNQIKNIYGEQVVMRGVAIRDPWELANSPVDKHFSAEDYRILAQDWGANIIRVPILPLWWTFDEDYMEKYLDPIVRWGEEYGLYIFLGWHAHGNPITSEVEQPASGPVPNERNRLNPDPELAKSALRALTERYRDKPWVLYGTFNEPSHISWSEWRPVAEELMDVVHAVHPEAVVFVSGVDWGYDLRGAIKDPVRRNNVIYETHPYPGKGEGWKTVLDELGKTSPVFLGEWGFDPDTTERNLRANAEGYGLNLVRYARERNIGWTAWHWVARREFGPVDPLVMLASWDSYTHTTPTYGSAQMC